MKRLPFLILLQVIFAIIAGYLISKMSWMGKVGIYLVYKEYTLLKTWWKTALVIFIIQALLILLLWTLKKRYPVKITIQCAIILLLIGLIGLYATYYDFHNTFSHQLLNEKFHLGGYLFWIGWMSSCVYFMVTPYNEAHVVAQNNTPLNNDPT